MTGADGPPGRKKGMTMNDLKPTLRDIIGGIIGALIMFAMIWGMTAIGVIFNLC